MTILVVGASGKTGLLLVGQLLKKGQKVKLIVRSPEKLPESIKDHKHVFIIQASILQLSDVELAKYINKCDAVMSCLGHNPSLKGIFGQPKRLVSDAIHLLCDAIMLINRKKPIPFILMNTAGNRNHDLNEKISKSENIVIMFLRYLLPPHVDNEMAAEYLRINIGHENKDIEWVIVRPESLIDEDQVSDYKLYPSPIRSAIFNAGKTSRINTANFMANLILDDKLWTEWKGQMPVIYNSSE